MNKRLKHLTYSAPCDRKRDPKFPHGRDSGAFSDLRAPAEALGYEWDAELLLYVYRGSDSGDELLGSIADFADILPSDCLVMCTRPPLSDEETNERRGMERSHSYLEKVIFRVVARYLAKCCRSTVELNPDLVADWEKRQQDNVTAPPVFFSFSHYNDARLKGMRNAGETEESLTYPTSSYSSIGFFLHIGELPEFGCRLIIAWGMGGAETAAWCRIVRKQFSHWFEQPRFAVARMDFVDVPSRPQSVDYADRAGVKVLLDHVLDEPPGAATSPPSPDRVDPGGSDAEPTPMSDGKIPSKSALKRKRSA